MLKKEVESLFKEQFPNWKELTATDKRVTWNDFTEHLRASGEITERQAYSWDQPKFIKGEK